MMALTVEQREAVATARDPYLRVVDLESQTEYVLMRADIFERLNNRLFDSEPMTADEEERLFADAAKRARWDDPEFDVYNDVELTCCGRTARPDVSKADLDKQYREMAADKVREAEAREWCEALIGDVADEIQ